MERQTAKDVTALLSCKPHFIGSLLYASRSFGPRGNSHIDDFEAEYTEVHGELATEDGVGTVSSVLSTDRNGKYMLSRGGLFLRLTENRIQEKPSSLVHKVNEERNLR